MPKDYEDLKKQVSVFEPTKKENEQLKHQLALKELEKKYPDVNFELVQPGPKEQMEACAAKLQAMVDKKAASIKPPESKPGDRWNGIPPLGGVQQDMQQPELDKSNIRKEMDEASKKGDLKGVMDACFKINPKGTAGLFDTLKQ